ADDPLSNGILESQLVKTLAVHRLVVHREHVVILAPQYSFRCRHEQPPADRNVLVRQEGCKHLPLYSHSIVSLIENREVKTNPGPSGGLRQPATTVIGGENDATTRSLSQERDDVITLGCCWDTKVIGFADKLVAFKIAGGFVAAHDQPLRCLAARKVLA